MSTAEELERLVALRDRGVLSEEEFQAEKARVLRHSSAAAGPSSRRLRPSRFPQPSGPSGDRPHRGSSRHHPDHRCHQPIRPPSGGGEGGQTQGVLLTSKHVLIGLVILAVIGAGAGLGFALTGKSTPAGTPARYSYNRRTPRARTPSPPTSD